MCVQANCKNLLLKNLIPEFYQRKLPHVVPLPEREHEPDEADAIQRETDQTVVGHQEVKEILQISII